METQAQSLDFSTTEQYTNNFYLSYMQPGSPTGTVAVNTTSGRLVHNASGGSTGAWIYDTAPSLEPSNTFSNFTLDMDFSVAGSSGSVGVFFGGSSRTSSALALFNINNSGSNDQLRLFSLGADMTSAGVGSGNTAYSSVPSIAGYTSNNFYHLKLTVNYQNSTDAMVTFTISDPTTTLTSVSISGLVTGLNSSGEIGIRSYTGAAGSNNFDNFVISTVIPEPSTFALLGGLGALGFALSRRRR